MLVRRIAGSRLRVHDSRHAITPTRAAIIAIRCRHSGAPCSLSAPAGSWSSACAGTQHAIGDHCHVGPLTIGATEGR